MKIMSVVGARPQFVKAAPMARALKEYQDRAVSPVRHVLVHTGQHYDYKMSEVFFEQLGIPAPDYHLAAGSGSHGQQTGVMLERLERVLLDEKPDTVVVYGDTNTTLAGALAAVKLHYPLAHVEAGLRSYNRRMAEEINRIVTDHVADILFCPTALARDNLSREGITRGVHLVGNVMYDSLLYSVDVARRTSMVLRDLGLTPGRYYLATIHRAENTEELPRLKGIFLALRRLGERTGLPVLCPLHPRTRGVLESAGVLSLASSLCLLEPMPYFDFIMLEAHAASILTDSGGVQEEAYCLRVPCVTLRDDTERVETVESGWNVLAGADSERIVRSVMEPSPRGEWRDLYGGGQAARRIAEILCGAGCVADLPEVREVIDR